MFLKAKRQTPESEVVRLGLILSDEALLYETLQEPNTANSRYESAMRHFSHVNASLRMAETLLSWARLSGSQQHFQQAATLFQQVGFASGLSVVDKYLSGRKNALDVVFGNHQRSGPALGPVSTCTRKGCSSRS